MEEEQQRQSTAESQLSAPVAAQRNAFWEDQLAALSSEVKSMLATATSQTDSLNAAARETTGGQ